jgi:hypothetical protein
MRRSIALLLLLFSVGRLGAQASAAPVPERPVVDSGAAVRVRLDAGAAIDGRLLANNRVAVQSYESLRVSRQARRLGGGGYAA